MHSLQVGIAESNPMSAEGAHQVQHLKWASLKLLLHLRSLHLFCISFTLKVGIIMVKGGVRSR